MSGVPDERIELIVGFSTAPEIPGRLKDKPYGVVVLGAPLVVVLGHERCGAVQAAVEVVERDATYPGSIGQMIEPIIPAVLHARRMGGTDLLDASVRQNVLRIVRRLRDTEQLLVEPQREGRLGIVGAHYDLDDGSVEFFD